MRHASQEAVLSELDRCRAEARAAGGFLWVRLKGEDAISDIGVIDASGTEGGVSGPISLWLDSQFLFSFGEPEDFPGAEMPPVPSLLSDQSGFFVFEVVNRGEGFRPMPTQLRFADERVELKIGEHSYWIPEVDWRQSVEHSGLR
jgi:hypothetical protein